MDLASLTETNENFVNEVSNFCSFSSAVFSVLLLRTDILPEFPYACTPLSPIISESGNGDVV